MSAGDELIGSTLGAYRIESKIGAGATGVVFAATRQDDPRPVALKVLHDNLGSISGLERRFSREARALKKVVHPNIVQILDFGVDEGRTYIAMELLEGHTLEESLEDGPMPLPKVLGYFDAILEALAAAHEHSIVHRDLKPANVFLTKDGGVKLLDFGLAKMLSVDELSQEGTLTRRGRIVGTPAYMAPEQITGVFIDVRADVYALGVMLYELLADRRPFLSERRSELLRAHLLEPVPKITDAREGLWVHPALDALLMRSLAKDPGTRYADGGAMLQAFRALPPNPARLEIPTARLEERKRTGPTSAVISENERKAITESAGLVAVPAPEIVPRATERDHPTEPPPVAPPPRSSSSALPTLALFVLSLVLLATAAALWLGLMAP
jgi:serine/threonine-protein kinase